jgi:hypothetical protein
MSPHMSARRLTSEDVHKTEPCQPRAREARSWLGILTKVRSSIRFDIPLGYQDETGFHHGTTAESSEPSSVLREW